MAKLHSRTVATYRIFDKKICVDLCWQGDNPEDDLDRFYDFYDSEGVFLNEGNPWHDDGKGIPNRRQTLAFLAQVAPWLFQ